MTQGRLFHLRGDPLSFPSDYQLTICNILLKSSGACIKGTNAETKVAVRFCALVIPHQLPGGPTKSQAGWKSWELRGWSTWLCCWSFDERFCPRAKACMTFAIASAILILYPRYLKKTGLLVTDSSGDMAAPQPALWILWLRGCILVT